MTTPPEPPPPGSTDPDGLPAPPAFGQPGAGRLGPVGAAPVLPSTPPGPPATSRGPLIAVIVGTIVVIVLAVAVLIVRNDDGGEVAATTTRPARPTTTSIAPSTTTSAAPTSTAAATTTAAPTTAPSTTTAPTTTAAPPPTVPEGSLDLGRGVHVPLPEGWTVVNGPDEATTISDGVRFFSAQVLARPAGEGPQAVLQELVDTFDGDSAAVSYSPVSFQGTIGGVLPADHYRLLYSTYAVDGARLSGRLDAHLRGDGLVAVTDTWSTEQSDPVESAVPPSVTDSLTSTLTAAPAIGPAGTLAVVAPFRVATVHPFVGSSGLAGFTLPPGFDATDRTTDGGVVIGAATNGRTDLLGISLPSAGTVDGDFAIVTATLDQRYGGIVFEQPSPQGTRDGWQRLGAGFAGTLNGRPIAGGVDVWQVPGATAYAFAYLYYADIAADGANPDPSPTQFAYAAYADSL